MKALEMLKPDGRFSPLTQSTNLISDLIVENPPLMDVIQSNSQLSGMLTSNKQLS